MMDDRAKAALVAYDPGEVQHYRDLFQGSLSYRHTLLHNRKLSAIMHDHTYYEIVIIVEGIVNHMLNGHLQTLRHGDFVFINPGDVHQYRGHTDMVDLISMQIKPDEMDRFLDAYGLQGVLTDRDRALSVRLPDSTVYAAFELQMRMLMQPEAYQQVLYRMLLGEIMQGYLSVTLESVIPSWLRIAMDHMKNVNNAAEGLPAFLRLTSLSHPQLCRVMKKYCGLTPQMYIKNLRLDLAYQKIVSTDSDFMTIAMEVGYNSFSHFCCSFKERYGISASELRRQSISQNI